MVDYMTPVRIDRGDGDLVRLLLQEEWYDTLKPIYDWFVELGDVVSVNVPPTVAGPATDFINQMTVDFGVGGFTISLCVLGLLKRAAEGATTLVKFTYADSGRLGTTRLGESRLGESKTIIRELAEHE